MDEHSVCVRVAEGIRTRLHLHAVAAALARAGRLRCLPVCMRRLHGSISFRHLELCLRQPGLHEDGRVGIGELTSPGTARALGSSGVHELLPRRDAGGAAVLG